MLAGTAMAAVTILKGDATVLYTFYAPLKASPWFYIGATLLVLGTWVVAFEIFENVNYFRKANPGKPVPLVVFCTAATFVMWISRDARRRRRDGPADSLGFRLDVRHQRHADADVLLVLRSPASLLLDYGRVHHLVQHHPDALRRKRLQRRRSRGSPSSCSSCSRPRSAFTTSSWSPGIASAWKMLHTVTTYGVAIPSSSRLLRSSPRSNCLQSSRDASGFIGTVKALPWNDPTFSGAALGMLLFILGGFGGLVNASYSMDTVVHNTIWIVGHFHVTVGGPVGADVPRRGLLVDSAAYRARACGSRSGRSSRRACGSSGC